MADKSAPKLVVPPTPPGEAVLTATEVPPAPTVTAYCSAGTTVKAPDPYADDFVVTFQQEEDARRFHQELEERLVMFGLSVAPEKTKVLEFGPLAQRRAKERGEKAETFDFLGFTHYCGRTMDGRRFRMKRMTIGKRFTAKLKMMKES